MSTESIYSQRRPGFPREGVNNTAYVTEIEYVGLAVDLRAASPDISTEWGGYPGVVADASLEPLENTDWAILRVIVERKFDASADGSGTGQEKEVAFEIDWVDVQRPLYEHPEFAMDQGGEYELTAEDMAAIEKWKENPNVDYKKEFIYYTGADADTTSTLSTNAKMFARGVQLGLEYYVDKAPVATRSATYVNGPPPEGEAGKKEDPTGFPNLPDGYEWIRSADRALRAGGQTKWQRDTSWIGAVKVLIDSEELFWDEPT